MTKLSPRIDRLGWILIALAVIFFFIIPLPYYIYIFNNGDSVHEWGFIVWVFEGLGILMTFAFFVHQSSRKMNIETKQNPS